MRKPTAGITLKPIYKKQTNQSELGVLDISRGKKKNYMSTPNQKNFPKFNNDYIDMSSQNILASIHPDRESNVEIFKRYNPDYNQPLNGRLTKLS